MWKFEYVYNCSNVIYTTEIIKIICKKLLRVCTGIVLVLDMTRTLWLPLCLLVILLALLLADSWPWPPSLDQTFPSIWWILISPWSLPLLLMIKLSTSKWLHHKLTGTKHPARTYSLPGLAASFDYKLDINHLLSSPGPSPCPNRLPSRIKVPQKKKKEGFGPWADTIIESTLTFRRRIVWYQE